MNGVLLPGPMEVIIVLAIVAIVVTVVVVVIASTRRSDSASRNNPNLAPCPDCGRLISIRATSCPHCGGPVQLK